ncbi:MAG: permease, partial [Acidobacteriota bacterium]
MDGLLAILDASWIMLVQASPYILFGLAAAGLIHVLVPESLVLRWMGAPGLSGVARAAMIGVPLPVCSCGVVPITVELRRKGASRPAAQSFLITTPESSIDSIFLTWGMMGPVMAIARPVAAFFTAVLGGILSIASARSLDELTGRRHTESHAAEGTEGHGHDRGHHHHDHDHSHGHDHDHDLAFAGSDQARRALRLGLRRVMGLRRRGATQSEEGVGPEMNASETDEANRSETSGSEVDETNLWRDLVRPALRYGFGDLLDDLAFWLVVGIGLAGVLTALLPDNLDELGL